MVSPREIRAYTLPTAIPLASCCQSIKKAFSVQLSAISRPAFSKSTGDLVLADI
jgi:hypothetical protein